MTDKLHEIEIRYDRGLREFLAHRGEPPLLKAYELGRLALTVGMGVIDMAGVHHRALAASLARERSGMPNAERLRAAETFFIESLSSFEMVHRGRVEANAALYRLNEALEEEARRIAQTLHDEAGQLLATVYLMLAELDRDVAGAAGHVARIGAQLDQVRSHLRRLAHELRPPILDNLGLIPALRFLADGVARRTGLVVNVESSIASRLNRASETALYRIAQEALSNVARHAKATRVDIRVQSSRAGHATCTIADDGVGFNAETVLAKHGTRGLGLAGIQERLVPLNGALHIETQPGQGTKLVVTISRQR